MTNVLPNTLSLPDCTAIGVGVEPEVYGCLTYKESGYNVPEAAVPMLEEFDELWSGLHSHLQWPLQNDENRHGGFTGHRIVEFGGRMGRAALGFQLTWNGDEGARTIIASRRKVYADNRRRQNYTSDETALADQEIMWYPADPRLRFRLGILGVWLDRYSAAEVYPSDTLGSL